MVGPDLVKGRRSSATDHVLTIESITHMKLVGPLPASTPSSLLPSKARGREIPDDLLREASLRLGIMSLLGAVLWTVGTLAAHVAIGSLIKTNSGWADFQTTDAIAAVMVIVSLALFAYTRRSRQEPRVILDIGLGYLVVTSLAVGMLMHASRSPLDVQIIPMVSWTGAVVLMFAAIVPTQPRKMLLTGLLAVSMNPIAMLIGRARGILNFGSAVDTLRMHYPDYILAGGAGLTSHGVTQRRQQGTKARGKGSHPPGAPPGPRRKG